MCLDRECHSCNERKSCLLANVRDLNPNDIVVNAWGEFEVENANDKFNS